MSDARRRLAAIMFTDMVGFAALTQEDEARALALLEQHNQLLRPIFPRFHGTEVKSIGDSFLVEFESALEATTCALEVQRTLRRHNEAAGAHPQILVRIGLHLGDVLRTGNDVLGDAVNIASRIEPLADPGGICLTGPVYEQVRNKLPASFVLLPPSELKNIQQAVAVYRLETEPEAPSTPANGPIPRTVRRLAVLPFANMSPDAQDEFFADGLTEELITELARIPGCEVIARTSVMRYKDAPKGIREVGRELKVDVALEGSVRKAGNQLRITVQLIDARTEAHLWADRFDREMRMIFELQTEIATRVASALQLELQPRNPQSASQATTPNLAAYENYLKGRQLWWSAGEQNYRTAILYFEKAIALDPGFALAYCGLADAWALLGNSGSIPLQEGLARAEPAARKALALSPDLADSHVSLAPILYNRYDWSGAVRELRRAVELDPNNVLGHYWLAVSLAVRGELEEALRESRRAAELDPLSRQAVLRPAVFLYEMRDYRAAREHFRDVERRLGFRSEHFESVISLALGEWEAALSEARKALDGGFEHSPLRRAVLAIALERAGQHSESARVLDGLVSDARGGRVPAGAVALVYAVWGEPDRAFEWFERAYEERSALVVEDLRVEPILDPIRGDPRFAGLLRKFNHI